MYGTNKILANRKNDMRYLASSASTLVCKVTMNTIVVKAETIVAIFKANVPQKIDNPTNNISIPKIM